MKKIAVVLRRCGSEGKLLAAAAPVRTGCEWIFDEAIA